MNIQRYTSHYDNKRHRFIKKLVYDTINDTYDSSNKNNNESEEGFQNKKRERLFIATLYKSSFDSQNIRYNTNNPSNVTSGNICFLKEGGQFDRALRNKKIKNMILQILPPLVLKHEKILINNRFMFPCINGLYTYTFKANQYLFNRGINTFNDDFKEKIEYDQYYIKKIIDKESNRPNDMIMVDLLMYVFDYKYEKEKIIEMLEEGGYVFDNIYKRFILGELKVKTFIQLLESKCPKFMRQEKTIYDVIKNDLTSSFEHNDVLKDTIYDKYKIKYDKELNLNNCDDNDEMEFLFIFELLIMILEFSCVNNEGIIQKEYDEYKEQKYFSEKSIDNILLYYKQSTTNEKFLTKSVIFIRHPEVVGYFGNKYIRVLKNVYSEKWLLGLLVNELKELHDVMMLKNKRGQKKQLGLYRLFFSPLFADNRDPTFEDRLDLRYVSYLHRYASFESPIEINELNFFDLINIYNLYYKNDEETRALFNENMTHSMLFDILVYHCIKNSYDEDKHTCIMINNLFSRISYFYRNIDKRNDQYYLQKNEYSLSNRQIQQKHTMVMNFIEEVMAEHGSGIDDLLHYMFDSLRRLFDINDIGVIVIESNMTDGIADISKITIDESMENMFDVYNECMYYRLYLIKSYQIQQSIIKNLGIIHDNFLRNHRENTMPIKKKYYQLMDTNEEYEKIPLSEKRTIYKRINEEFEDVFFEKTECQIKGETMTLGMEVLEEYNSFSLFKYAPCIEQESILHHTKCNPIVIVNGSAGSGKSEITSNIVHQYHENEVIGLSFMASHATNLYNKIVKNSGKYHIKDRNYLVTTCHQFLVQHQKMCCSGMAVCGSSKNQESTLDDIKREMWKKSNLPLWSYYKYAPLRQEVNCPLQNIKVVVFDEFGVMYEELFCQVLDILCKCCPNLVQIVVSGDINQLPQIQSGHLSRELIYGFGCNYMEHSHRQNNLSLTKISRFILKNDYDGLIDCFNDSKSCDYYFCKNLYGLYKIRNDNKSHLNVVMNLICLPKNNFDYNNTLIMCQSNIMRREIIKHIDSHFLLKLFPENKYNDLKNSFDSNDKIKPNHYYKYQKINYKKNDYKKNLINNEQLIVDEIIEGTFLHIGQDQINKIYNNVYAIICQSFQSHYFNGSYKIMPTVLRDIWEKYMARVNQYRSEEDKICLEGIDMNDKLKEHLKKTLFDYLKDNRKIFEGCVNINSATLRTCNEEIVFFLQAHSNMNKVTAFFNNSVNGYSSLGYNRFQMNPNKYFEHGYNMVIYGMFYCNDNYDIDEYIRNINFQSNNNINNINDHIRWFHNLKQTKVLFSKFEKQFEKLAERSVKNHRSQRRSSEKDHNNNNDDDEENEESTKDDQNTTEQLKKKMKIMYKDIIRNHIMKLVDQIFLQVLFEMNPNIENLNNIHEYKNYTYINKKLVNLKELLNNNKYREYYQSYPVNRNALIQSITEYYKINKIETKISDYDYVKFIPDNDHPLLHSKSDVSTPNHLKFIRAYSVHNRQKVVYIPCIEECMKYTKPSCVVTLYGAQSNSQKNAILILPYKLSKEEFYMASTRAEEKFVLISNEKTIRETIKNEKNSRISYLGHVLRKQVSLNFQQQFDYSQYQNKLNELSKKHRDFMYHHCLDHDHTNNNNNNNDDEEMTRSQKKKILFSNSKRTAIIFQHNQQFPDIGKKQRNQMKNLQTYSDYAVYDLEKTNLPFNTDLSFSEIQKNYQIEYDYQPGFSTYYDPDSISDIEEEQDIVLDNTYPMYDMDDIDLDDF